MSKLLLLLFLFGNLIFAQKTTFTYTTELCECTGKFNQKKYTKTQLENTKAYLWWSKSIDTSGYAMDPEEIESLNINELKNECDTVTSELENLDFVKNKFWTQVQQDRIRYFKSTCNLREITMRAYQDRKALLEFETTDSTAIFYRDALIAGGEQMLEAWKTLNEAQKKINANPLYIQKKFEEQYNSPNRMAYALINLMTYGWWNRANHTLPHINETYEMQQEFEKLFTDLKCVCDEP